MPTVLPLEITETIINILAQGQHTLPSIKACALVSHVFLHLCRKHIWAALLLNGIRHSSATTDSCGIRFGTTHKLQQLLFTTPEIGPYIRELHYTTTGDDFKRPTLVLQTFKKITHLKALSIMHSQTHGDIQWNDNPLRPALLHLMHLPTLFDLTLYNVNNFMAQDLVPCINLKSFEFDGLLVLDTNDALVSNLPNSSIRLSNFTVDIKHAGIISKMCAMQRADQIPFFDFTHLRAISISIADLDDLQASRTLFSRCKNLTTFNFVLENVPWDDNNIKFTRVGLSEMLQPSMDTLKHLQVGTSIYDQAGCDDFVAGLSFELEAMKGSNIIENVSIDVCIGTDANCKQADVWGRLDKALTQSGWTKLQRVSLTLSTFTYLGSDDELGCILKRLPETQFPRLSSSKKLLFKFTVDSDVVFW